MILRLLLSAFIFGCAASVAVALAQLLIARVPDLGDAPRRTNLHPAIPVAFTAALGVLLAARGAETLQLAVIALLAVPLVGSWYSDAHKGIIPDWFTLLPLAIIAVYVILHHAWAVALFAAITFAIFACAALISRGRGMGWGDAKLAGVAGAILGLPGSFGVLGVACLAATIASIVRDRGKTPVAFGPYIAVSVLISTILMV